MALIVSNGLVVTFDGEMRLVERGAVRISRGLITAVGPLSEIESDPADVVIDASGCMILPGFTNAHCHSIEAWAKGRTDRMKLEAWLEAIFPPLDRASPEIIRIAILLISAEMLKTGVTTVIDHFRQTPMRHEALAAAVAAYRESGLNAGIAIMLRDSALPSQAVASDYSIASLSELCETAIRSWHRPADGIGIMLGPSAPHRCSDDLLEKIAALSRRHDVRIHTHVDETMQQRRDAGELYGCSSIRHLADMDLLGPKLSIAHAVWTDAGDLDLLADTGTWVVHNPISNARLGSGIAPLTELLRRGVGVALGTDGAASNDSQNLVEAMKMAALLQALRDLGEDAAPSAREIAVMATVTGGKILGGTHGALVAGMRGDVIAIAMEDCAFRPLNDVYRQLVYAGARIEVRHSVIGGRHIVDRGRITTFDEFAVYRATEDLKKRIYQ